MRKLKGSWLREYTAYVDNATDSPKRFHFWAGATVIAAALKRHCWIDRKTFKLYPNLYTVLVARPGIGKGAAIAPALGILKDSLTTNVLSDRITMEYVLEKLSKGFPATTSTGGKITLSIDSSVLLVSTELSVFISASQFAITALTDLWDTKEGEYGYGTRGRGEFNISNPCVSLLGGSAQEWLVKSVPSDAVGGGFTRRVNFVLGVKKGQSNPWPTIPSKSKRDELVLDLREIGKLRGEMQLSTSARSTFESVYAASEPGEFDDEATAAYKISRWANALKLAMVVSASRGDTLRIERDDLETAVQLTEEVSKDIPLVFRAVGESELTSATDKVLRYIEIKGFATRDEIMKANWRHMTSQDLDRIIVTMREAGYIGEKSVGNRTVYFDKSNIVEP